MRSRLSGYCGLYFVILSYLGKIISPPDGTALTFLPGSSENITWTFDDKISQVTYRTWFFRSSDGLRFGTLGVIAQDTEPNIPQNVLSGVNIIKPATLVLNNVNHSYDGTYTFTLATTESFTSNVIVFIASKYNS